MDTTLYILLFCLMWQYCYLNEAHEAPEQCSNVLSNKQVKPINVSVNVRERVLYLSWDCDFPPEIQSKTEYEIYLKHAKEDDDQYKYEIAIKKCSTTITLGTLSSACVKVTPAINEEECQYLSSEKCVNLERNWTSAENVSCRVYNTSSMTCTWMFGKNAPDSTSYILSLRQGTTNVRCQQYENKIQTRTGACTFHDLRLHFFNDVTIVLQGSDPGIEVFEEKIKLAHIEMFNPPRDISVTSFEDILTIYWKSPQKQYSVGDHCFKYNIEKNKFQYEPETKDNLYTIQNVEKECSVRIRASGIEGCEMNTNWGEWSEWISCGPMPMVGKSEWQFELTPVILVSGLMLVLLIITTLQYKRIVKTCFPRIPQPKNYLVTTEDSKINLESNEHFSLKLQTSETEECIIIVKENFS
ncbi:interleukin-5 receptor subunit alpha-like [Rana temporaria]|uniref:interleukin-5 receptor subunit alpha-like n=1 Tax=Rana temporaria TaxID=8407 RepID=UPI001AADA9A5|nr:interleukin-5 receptor subunit alpha-like [Rana temporaria]XP_040194130.1 interleukin-5 receptor subunit alpha-like [Rana temporaria]